MQLTADAEETRKRWEAVPALASVVAARRSAAGRERARGDERSRRRAAGARRRAALRHRTSDGVHRRGRVAVAHDAARQRSLATTRSGARRCAGSRSPRRDPVSLTPPASASPGDDIRWRVSRARCRLRAAERRDGRRSRHGAGWQGANRSPPLRMRQARDGRSSPTSGRSAPASIARPPRSGRRNGTTCSRRRRCWSAAPTPR